MSQTQNLLLCFSFSLIRIVKTIKFSKDSYKRLDEPVLSRQPPIWECLNPVSRHPPGKVGISAIQFLVGKIAPPSYSLGQRKINAGKIAKVKHINFSHPGENEYRDDRANYGSIYGKAPSQTLNIPRRSFLYMSHVNTTKNNLADIIEMGRAIKNISMRSSSLILNFCYASLPEKMQP